MAMARKVTKSVQQIAATMVEQLWLIQRSIQTPARTASGGEGVVRMRTTNGHDCKSSKDDEGGEDGGGLG